MSRSRSPARTGSFIETVLVIELLLVLLLDVAGRRTLPTPVLWVVVLLSVVAALPRVIRIVRLLRA